MKVLLLLGTDAANLHIVHICKELIHRRHEVVAYSVFSNESSDYAFKGMNIPIIPYKKLTPKIASTFDVALCGDGGMAQMDHFHLYTFVYTLAIDERVTNGADFLFNYCTNRRPHYALNCASMAIGNPKNDGMIFCNTNREERKQILYVDSGHIPFGRRGKEQIAECLLKICAAFPEYQLVIKPRWLRDTNTNFTHKNTDHIYTIIEEKCNGSVPANLCMLQEHIDLHQLIEESTSVITLYSSVIMDVLSHNKGLIILTGYDCEDQIDFRTSDFHRKEQFWGQSGCLVSIDKVVEYLPAGIKSDGVFLRKILPDITGASARAVDVMEFIQENYLIKKCFPAVKEYYYHNYKAEMSQDATLNWNKLDCMRLENMGRFQIATLMDKLSVQLDFTKCYEQICIDSKEKHNFYDFRRNCTEHLFDCLIENKMLLHKTAIDESLLLQALYERGYETEILSISLNQVLAVSALHYYLGMIYSKKENEMLALYHFYEFLNEYNRRNYAVYPQETPGAIKNSYNYIFKVYDGTNLTPDKIFTLFQLLHQKGDELYVNFRLRQKIHQLLPKCAEALEQTSSENALNCLKCYAKYEYKYCVSPLKGEIAKINGKLNRICWSKTYKFVSVVTFLPSKLKGGIRCIQDNGWEYTRHHTVKKLKDFVMRPYNKLKFSAMGKIYSIFRNKVMDGYRLYSDTIKKYGVNSRLFLSAPATGDAYIFGQCFNSYVKQKYPIYNSILGVFGKGGVSAVQVYDIKNVEPYSYDEFKKLYNLIMFDSKSLVQAESLHYHIFHRHIAFLSYIEGLHGFEFYSQVKAYLGCDSENDIELPKFDYELPSELNTLFQSKQIVKGNTIVLGPYAKTVKSLPWIFWVILAQKLRAHGFDVCTNSVGDTEPPIDGTIPVFIPYQNLVPFIEQCGAVIGLRSGFLDIASTAKTLKIALHPKNNYNRSEVCDINETFSMSAMYGQPDQYDLIYTQEKQEELMEEIVNLVLQYLSLYDTLEGEKHVSTQH